MFLKELKSSEVFNSDKWWIQLSIWWQVIQLAKSPKVFTWKSISVSRKKEVESLRKDQLQSLLAIIVGIINNLKKEWRRQHPSIKGWKYVLKIGKEAQKSSTTLSNKTEIEIKHEKFYVQIADSDTDMIGHFSTPIESVKTKELFLENTLAKIAF